MIDEYFILKYLKAVHDRSHLRFIQFILVKCKLFDSNCNVG